MKIMFYSTFILLLVKNLRAFRKYTANNWWMGGGVRPLMPRTTARGTA